MGRILRWGLLQLCQSLVNGLYLFSSSLEERTNHPENEQIYHPNFVWYIETSSLGDINLMLYHLTALS